MARIFDDGVAVLDPPQQSNGKQGKGGKDEKRLNLIFSAGVFDDLASLAKERRTTMTEIVRLGLGLVKVAVHEAKKGNKLVVATEDGDVIKELILPG